jgi:nucleoside-diphosphate-sugar epimerase
MKKILITGGAGYIGSKLATRLLNMKYEVTILDNLMFVDDSLNHLFEKKNLKFFKGDINNKKFIKKHVKDKDIIIPLAALVGAPLCEKFKKLAIKTNLNAIEYLVKSLKNNQKIIFPTSNSGYGIGEKNKYCDERSPLNPISLYGKTKSQAEKKVLNFRNSVCFRLATIFGYSYRMRTDLLVNNFVYRAIKEKKLFLFQPHFRRNYIHVEDVVNAFVFAIENFSKVKGEIFNLGLSSANLTKLQLAKRIKKQVPELKIKIVYNKKDPDQRNYFVSNKKIEKLGFKAKVTIDQGIKELVSIFRYSNIKIKNNY